MTRNEILGLLAIPLGSEEDRQLRCAAKEVAMARTGGKAYVWAAVGLDYAPCPMNCQFCSFGQDWGVVQEPSQLRREEALAQIRAFVEGGARFVVLRTTEFYSIPELLELVREIRRTIPGPYEVILNAGEFGPDIARQMVDAGVSGIYHACRLREGTDTPFDPALRLATMQSVTDSPLKLISLVEPMGPEHTHEEIADNFFNIVRHGAVISGAMARIPVPAHLWVSFPSWMTAGLLSGSPCCGSPAAAWSRTSVYTRLPRRLWPAVPTWSWWRRVPSLGTPRRPAAIGTILI